MANIQNRSDLLLQSISPRIASSTITPSTGLVFTRTKNTTTVAPTSMDLVAAMPYYTAPTVVWAYNVASAPTVWTTIAGAVASGSFPSKISTLTISNSTFLTHVGLNSKVTYRSTVSQASYADVVTTIEVLYANPVDDAVITFSRDNITLPVTPLDVGTYTGTDTSISIKLGATLLTEGASGANTFSVSATVTSGTVTIGSTSGAGTSTFTYGNISGMNSTGLTATAKITYTITVRDVNSAVTVYTRYQNIVKSASGATGGTGSPGADGTKSVTITCFGWFTSTPTIPSVTYTYNWATGAVSGYPIVTSPSSFTMTAAAATNTTPGLVLYMRSLVVTATATYTGTTNIDWSTGSTGSIGYTAAGTIGPQGDGARMMYASATSSTTFTPASTAVISGDNMPTGGSTQFGVAGLTWASSPPTITAGESLFQSDGVYVIGGNTTWQTPYLSNLKVGSLSAISAILGTVQISSAGSLYSTGKTSSGSATAGFFMGDEGGTYKFGIGNSTNSMVWTGSALNITGTISGSTIKYGKTSSTDVTSAGYWLAAAGTLIVGGANKNLNWDGSSLKLTGTTFDLSSNFSITNPSYANYVGSISVTTAGLAISSADSQNSIFNGISLIAENTSAGTITPGVAYAGKVTMQLATVSSGQCNLDITPLNGTASVNVLGKSTGSVMFGAVAASTLSLWNVNGNTTVHAGISGIATINGAVGVSLNANSSALTITSSLISSSSSNPLSVYTTGAQPLKVLSYSTGDATSLQWVSTVTSRKWSAKVDPSANGVASNWYLEFTAGPSDTAYTANSTRNSVVISGAGDITALGNITAYSDVRIKTDVKVLENPISLLNSIAGYSYFNTLSERKDYGVIAQEVEKLMPDLIGSTSEYKTVSYNGIIAVLVEAVKELNVKVEKLRGI